MNASIIIGIAILAGIIVYGLKKTRSSKKSSGSSNGGGVIYTDDVVGPKPGDGSPQPQNPSDNPAELRNPQPKDLKDFR